MNKTQHGNIPFSKAKEVRRLRAGRPPETLAPVRPNLGTEAQYRRALDKLIAQMNTSVVHWLSAAYKRNEPVIAKDTQHGETSKSTGAGVRQAQDTPATSAAPSGRIQTKLALDELPAEALRRAVRKLARQWTTNFDRAADQLAAYFAQEMGQRSDKQLEQILRRGGFSVKFKATRAMNDVMRAAINENVALIKSIPAQYFVQVEGAVMRSVAAGRDLAPLTKFLQEQYGVTRRRAALIARDQNNKATATMNRVRQIELGITRARWRHSHGGKRPRPKHLAFDGKEYDIVKGAPIGDDGGWVIPGEEINCRCVSQSIIPGFD